MNSIDEVIAASLNKYASTGFNELYSLAEADDVAESFEFQDTEGAVCQVEINVHFESKSKDKVRVEATVYPQSDKWWRRFISISHQASGFVMTSDGKVNAYSNIDDFRD